MPDPYGPCLEIQVLPLQRRHLAPTQASETSYQHERLEPSGHAVGELEHLGDGEDRPLGRFLLVCAGDPARVLREDLVLLDLRH
jgi:hypothetical protein